MAMRYSSGIQSVASIFSPRDMRSRQTPCAGHPVRAWSTPPYERGPWAVGGGNGSRRPQDSRLQLGQEPPFRRWAVGRGGGNGSRPPQGSRLQLGQQPPFRRWAVGRGRWEWVQAASGLTPPTRPGTPVWAVGGGPWAVEWVQGPQDSRLQLGQEPPFRRWAVGRGRWEWVQAASGLTPPTRPATPRFGGGPWVVGGGNGSRRPLDSRLQLGQEPRFGGGPWAVGGGNGSRPPQDSRLQLGQQPPFRRWAVGRGRWEWVQAARTHASNSARNPSFRRWAVGRGRWEWVFLAAVTSVCTGCWRLMGACPRRGRRPGAARTQAHPACPHRARTGRKGRRRQKGGLAADGSRLSTLLGAWPPARLGACLNLRTVPIRRRLTAHDRPLTAHSQPLPTRLSACRQRLTASLTAHD